MINYILIAFGGIFAFIGLILFFKRIGENNASRIKVLGVELETGSSALVIFIAGVALIALGATNHQKLDGEPGTIANNKKVTDTAGKKEERGQQEERGQLYKEFTLTAEQPLVMNELSITITLMNQDVVLTADNKHAVKLRIWRNIPHPISDTAYRDPSGSGSGAVEQVVIVNAVTPVTITDVGAFKFHVSSPVIVNNRIEAIQVKMYRG